MTQSIKDVLVEMNTRPKKIQREISDNREMGAPWPAHNSQDLPADYWTDNELELI